VAIGSARQPIQVIEDPRPSRVASVRPAPSAGDRFGEIGTGWVTAALALKLRQEFIQLRRNLFDRLPHRLSRNTSEKRVRSCSVL
tara:strand:+ start:1455 stop:1709 length:255 start_codon:yes stop_codon:yes gene_type:complete